MKKYLVIAAFLLMFIWILGHSYMVVSVGWVVMVMACLAIAGIIYFEIFA